MNEKMLHTLVVNALQEDIGSGDHSTLCCIGAEVKGKAVLKIKQDGILAGVDVARYIFNLLDNEVVFNEFMKDGNNMKYGDIAFEVHTHVQTILKAERLVLNIMQRMSGIATLTRKYVDEIKNYKTKLLDTRKTTPNFRLLEKEAVKIGGGFNHRFGLYDMIMLKDNHIDFCGGIEKALKKAFDYAKQFPGLKIEIETRNLDDVKKVVETKMADRIMFDNFTPAEIVMAMKIVNGSVETEASGGINFENITEFAATGVDYISSGALIHQAKSLDLSLKAVII